MSDISFLGLVECMFGRSWYHNSQLGMVHEVPADILYIQFGKQVEVGQQTHIRNLQFLSVKIFSLADSFAFLPWAGMDWRLAFHSEKSKHKRTKIMLQNGSCYRMACH